MNNKLQYLKQFKGKKVDWVGFDTENETYYLFFEGCENGVAFDEMTTIPNSSTVAQAFLSANSDLAEMIEDLKKRTPPKVIAPEVTAPQAVPLSDAEEDILQGVLELSSSVKAEEETSVIHAEPVIGDFIELENPVIEPIELEATEVDSGIDGNQSQIDPSPGA